MLSPEQILEKSIDTGVSKVNKTFSQKMVLGFLGGALIAIGALAFLKATELFQDSIPGLGTIIGGFLFPVGLVAILLAGGELATGNMMVVGTSLFAKRISLSDYVINLITILFANFIGGLFVAYFLGHITGITDLSVAATVAQGKIDSNFIQIFFSAVGCNWLVALAVWMNFGGKDGASKFLLIYFPIALFVILGFQHSVANFFFMSAGALSNGTTWLDILWNAIPVILGNTVGGLVFVGGAYYYSFKSPNKTN